MFRLSEVNIRINGVMIARDLSVNMLLDDFEASDLYITLGKYIVNDRPAGLFGAFKGMVCFGHIRCFSGGRNASL